jgi:hypothetical protein
VPVMLPGKNPIGGDDGAQGRRERPQATAGLASRAIGLAADRLLP